MRSQSHTHLCIYTNTSSIFFCMKIHSLMYLNSWLKWQFKGTLTFCSPPFKWTTVCLLITQKTPVRGFVEQLLLSKKSDIERTLSESDGWFDGWKKKERQPLCRQWGYTQMLLDTYLGNYWHTLKGVHVYMYQRWRGEGGGVKQTSNVSCNH